MRKLIGHAGATRGMLSLNRRAALTPSIGCSKPAPTFLLCCENPDFDYGSNAPSQKLTVKKQKQKQTAFLAARFGHVTDLGNCNVGENHCERFLKSLLKGTNSSGCCLFSLAQ